MIMHRNKFQVIMILFASLTVFACDKISGPGPNEILNSYLDASLKGRYEEAYSYVSAEDKAIKDLQSYLKENSKEDNPVAQAIVSKVSYKILKLEKAKKTASAEVEITLPDFGAIMADLMGAAFESAFGGGGEKKMEALMAKKLESGEVPLTTKKETFSLQKENDGWKVFLDWKSEKAKKEKQTTISNLMAEAKELRESRKLEGAIQKYEKVLELDSEMVDAKEGIGEVKTEIKQLEEKQAYIENVVLYDLQSRYHETYLEKKVPGVEFKIKNKGDRTLKEVKVTVYFKDASGTIIAEKSYHPVLVTEYSFSGDNNPLKPNYIWQMEGGKFYKADSVPSEWKEGAVSAKIANIEFE
jgi:hypothetical protein